MNPFPGPNSVLIVDNCRTHKSSAVREAVEAAGEIAISYALRKLTVALQGASTFFSPRIRPTGTQLKRHSAAVRASLQALSQRSVLTGLLHSAVKYRLRRDQTGWEEADTPEIGLMEVCMASVTASKARGWYTHSGYLVQS